jgi:hypothetical protein
VALSTTCAGFHFAWREKAEEKLLETIKTTEVVFREDLYPRFKPNPAVIQEYAANVELLPPIEVDQHGILIDGYHRWKAYQTAGLEAIPRTVTEVRSEAELQMLAVERNAKHGQQLTVAEKQKYARLWWEAVPAEEVCRILSIGDRTLREWTRTQREQKEAETKQRIYDLWLACHTQEGIAEQVGVDQATVSREIAGFMQIGNDADLHNFRGFTAEVYALWNFAKAANEVRHFGNIPPEVVDNLLYYYTKPFDVVFDPFGGGGSTIDRCLARKRRYYVGDLNPIPARADIRKHDITTGLPTDLPVPDLVFLDPPYWAQAKGKYSQDPTDLANVNLEAFLTSIGNIARDVKRKWTDAHSGTLALIIGPWKDDGRFVDLPFLCYERVKKYLTLVQRICVPYSTQVHGGAYVKLAQERKEVLYLTRDLMVFQR